MTFRVYLTVILLTLVGACTPLVVPDVVPDVSPPDEFPELAVVDTTCPRVTGAFKRIPKIATQVESRRWSISDGEFFTYALLVPLERAQVDDYKPMDVGIMINQDEIWVDSEDAESEVRFAAYKEKDNKYEVYTLSRKNRDYVCSNGSLVFPEFIVSGGGEGFTLNARTVRKASVSENGDLYIYEQVSSYDVRHKYFLFEKKPSQN